jgi:hypothetical protein
MSIERNLRQTQWGVMRTNVQGYFLRLNPEEVIDLILDGSYYGVVGNNKNFADFPLVNTLTKGRIPRYHLLGMIQRDGSPSVLAGKSVFGIYEEDRITDRLIFKSYFVLENALQVGKGKFGEPILLKDNKDCFSVSRTTAGFEMSYLSAQGNSYFRVRYTVDAANGTAVLGGFAGSIPAVEMRKNDDTTYRTWSQIFNQQLGLTGTASASFVNVVKPYKTANNNSWDYLGSAGTSFPGSTASGSYVGSTNPLSGRVFITNSDPDLNYDGVADTIGIVSYVWGGNVSATVTSNLETWWNSKLPNDPFDSTFSAIQVLNHPLGMLAIFQKTRVDGQVRRYYADFTAANQLIDVSPSASDCDFVLDKMVASSVNVTCYWSYDNDKFDSTLLETYFGNSGRLVYTWSKGLVEKADAFTLRLLNYDLSGTFVNAFVSNDNTYLVSGSTNEGSKIPSINNLIYFADRAAVQNRTFHLEREDMGNAFTDGINNETYYQTGIRGVQDIGKPVFVGYSAYPDSVGNFTFTYNGGFMTNNTILDVNGTLPVVVSFN